MNEDNAFEYLTDDLPQNNNIINSNNNPPVEDYHEFVEGLPDWDLEPPFEIVRRNQL